MTRIFGCTNRYIQGSNELANLHNYVKPYGNKAMVIIDSFIYPQLKEKIANEALKGIDVIFEVMDYDVTYKNSDRVKDKAEKEKVEIIIAVGGGKTIDFGKMVAYFAKLPIGIVPTAASVDAPVTSLSVVHKDNGDFEEYLFYQKSPEFLLVDSVVIANAPVRLFVAGMGDAVGTFFEARSNYEANGYNLLNAKQTRTGYAIAKLCYEMLITRGYQAKLGIERHAVSRDVEDLIETNILMSGIGAESGGLAAAHAFYNASHSIEKFHKFYHGEIVSFGAVIQLFLEGRSFEEIDELLDFLKKVGLPNNLKDYGFDKDLDEAEWMKLCQEACSPKDTMKYVPVDVSPEFLFATIKAASAYSENYQPK